MDIFQSINQFILQKNFSKAKELATNIPSEVDRYNVLGIIHFYEGNLDGALELFQTALKIDPVHPDVLFNYSKTLFEKGNYFESWRYLTRIPEKTWEVWDMLGDTQLKLGNPAMALHYYDKAFKSSNIPELKQKYDEVRKQYYKGNKLAIFCLPGLDSFIHDIASILSHVYDVRLAITTDSKQIVDTYTWADIVWLEWANEMAVQITNKLPKGHKKVLCRLHGYEALRTDFLSSLNWDNVDVILFVAWHVQKTAYMNNPNLSKKRSFVVNNGVNLSSFRFKNRYPGTDLVFVGNFNYKKNPALAIQILLKLIKKSPEYKLYWKGVIQDQRLKEYTDYLLEELNLKENFVFEEFGKDVDQFLENKNIFLSTSIHEGYGVAILEAMAKGLKPVIHNFFVAKEFYPQEFLFNDVDEAVAMITSNEYDSEKYRRFVEETSSLEKQIASILEILNEIKTVGTENNILSERVESQSCSISDKKRNNSNWDELWKDYSQFDSTKIMSEYFGASLRSETLEVLNRFFKLCGARILEVGTGTGAHALEFGIRGAEVVGIDVSENSIHLAKKLVSEYGAKNVSFEVYDGFLLSKKWSKEFFDIVFSRGVIEHFNDEELLKLLKEMAYAGKYVVVTVPYSKSEIYRLSKELRIQTNTWSYGFERDFETLRGIFERAGLIMLHEEVIGVGAEAGYARWINPNVVSLKLAENLTKFFRNESAGSWLVAIGTANEYLANIFKSLQPRQKIAFVEGMPRIYERDIPPVSIVVPILNRKKYISRLLENISHQVFRDFELIIVDDGSTDGTLDEVNKDKELLADCEVKIIRNETNLGTFKARQIGAENSEGKFVVFHDADDLIHPKTIERLLNDIENFEDRKPLLAVPCALMNNGSFIGQIWSVNFFKNDIERFTEEIIALSGRTSIINTLLDRQEVVNTGNTILKLLSYVGIEKLSVAEDSLLGDMLTLEGNLLFLPVFYTYCGYERGNPDSFSKKLERRIMDIPVWIGLLVNFLTYKKKMFDEKYLFEIERLMKENALKFYGEINGKKLIERYEFYKREFRKVLTNHAE
ncbi:glycosyltransferase [Fervidobacterium thailandense]|uniref:Uncharacterized protein n=1 Tax=Fervidobacterium thailandense TaxID=1008305 RepID=A0A1E3G2Y7_9BACT|nr:glycosyltransferase [Fervidobacterium thailandense]ODN30597.1 hypothetical protein A4H02_05000 [Fervidobacterium thailandense]